MKQVYFYIPEYNNNPHISALVLDGRIIDIVCFSVWAQAIESVINGNAFINKFN